jgi:hypothetical protein
MKKKLYFIKNILPLGGGDMEIIKKNLWQFNESARILYEIVLFAVQIIVVIFLLNSAIDRYSGSTVIKISPFTTAVNHKKNIHPEENMLDSEKILLSSRNIYSSK